MRPGIPFLHRWRAQADDRHVLAGEWEYAEGVVVRLTLDEQGNGRYRGKTGDSRHTRSSVIPGMACGFRRRMAERVDLRSSSRQIFQKGRDAGGSAASETDHTASQKGGTFHLSKKTARKDFSSTSAAP